jgi:hypothetical protein
MGGTRARLSRRLAAVWRGGRELPCDGVAWRTTCVRADDQLGELKAAFRADVHALAEWVETLRTDALTANVYARTSTRLLRQQNMMLKKRIGHNMLLTAQKQRRMLAWVGWRLVVHTSRAAKASAAKRSREVGERDEMIQRLEARLGETRATYLRQLRTLQAAHEAELDAAHEEIGEATEALGRLKTFSAHKLHEMAAQLESAQNGQPDGANDAQPDGAYDAQHTHSHDRTDADADAALLHGASSAASASASASRDGRAGARDGPHAAPRVGARAVSRRAAPRLGSGAAPLTGGAARRRGSAHGASRAQATQGAHDAGGGR